MPALTHLGPQRLLLGDGLSPGGKGGAKVVLRQVY